jgi:poly-gamma-glutamate capsule biosynthesis protein CapA/YwtB (metallophosphatase superfamily)
MPETISLVAVGDVLLAPRFERSDGSLIVGKLPKAFERDKPEAAFEKVSDRIRSADIAFCNVEGALSDRGKMAVGRDSAWKSPPHMIQGIKAGGFNIVSAANNHIMDYGPDAMLDTLSLLEQNGIAHIGAGINIHEARKPAFIEKKGCRIAFLGYSTDVNQPGRSFPASERKPGIVPIRVFALFAPPHLNLEDMEMMEEDIKEAKKNSDLTFVSLHFSISVGGSHTLAPHQEAMAKGAIEAGADLVLGHGPHALQAFEIYKGKAITYNMGNFVVDRDTDVLDSILVTAEIRDKKVKRVAFSPVRINEKGQPEIVSFESKSGERIKNLLRKISKRQNTEISFSGEEGVVLQ